MSAFASFLTWSQSGHGLSEFNRSLSARRRRRSILEFNPTRKSNYETPPRWEEHHEST
jgi:hypothetical protein